MNYNKLKTFIIVVALWLIDVTLFYYYFPCKNPDISELSRFCMMLFFGPVMTVMIPLGFIIMIGLPIGLSLYEIFKGVCWVWRWLHDIEES